MVDIARITDNLKLVNEIWVGEEESEISHPHDGNDQYYFIENSSFWFKHRNKCIVECIKKFSTSGELFVEIGSGNGYVTKAIHEAGFETLLIEPSMSGILNSQKRGLKNLVCAPFETIRFVGAVFNNMGIFDVLEHIRDDTEFLKKIHSVLIPNGYLYLTVPAYNFLWSGEDGHDGHWRRYAVTKLKNKLSSAGFGIVYASYFFTLLTLPILLFRTIPFLLGVKRKQMFETYQKENVVKNRFLEKALEWSFQREIRRIQNGESSHFGASIIIVAKKTTAPAALFN
jgi:SAM-dependent methyltransferase